jgi:Domain of unknown function (DUF932)
MQQDTNNINTLTIDEAIKRVPAIGATEPAGHVSDRYQFVSTRDILSTVQDYGWRITNATSQNQSPTAQHRVTLVHENDIGIRTGDGIPRIEMFNSHDRSKRLMFAIGFFRFVCSNGLIIASGPAETIRTKHRFTSDRLTEIMGQVSQIAGRFPTMMNTINDFKAREMSQEEMVAYAQYAIKGRFNYRPEMPKRFRDIGRTTEKLLSVRRDADEGNTTWQVFNRVQENLIQGIEGFNRPIRSYGDNVRVNQLLWKGAETALTHQGRRLDNALKQLLVKDGTKGKISV